MVYCMQFSVFLARRRRPRTNKYQLPATTLSAIRGIPTFVKSKKEQYRRWPRSANFQSAVFFSHSSAIWMRSTVVGWLENNQTFHGVGATLDLLSIAIFFSVVLNASGWPAISKETWSA